MRYPAIFVIVAAFMAGEVCADRVFTRNGVWEGSVVRETSTHIHLEKTDGSIITIPRDNIRRIECTAEADAADLLSRIAALKERAEDAYGRNDLQDALQLYRRIIEKAGRVRKRAGSSYDEALEIKNRAESMAGEIRDSHRKQGLFMADEAGPADFLKEKGLSFDAAAFVESAGMGDDDAVALFLQAGMDADARAEGGITALMQACRMGRVTTAGKLIEAGADVSLEDAQGLTALHYAMRSSNAALIGLIIDSTHRD